MSDFEPLNDQTKTLSQIKLDGHVEACVRGAYSLNIGVAEALRLAATVFIREFAARGFDGNSSASVFGSAVDIANRGMDPTSYISPMRDSINAGIHPNVLQARPRHLMATKLSLASEMLAFQDFSGRGQTSKMS